MKLIVGLGNPGIFYLNSRHNIGFSVIKALKSANKAKLKKEKGIPSLTVKIKTTGLDALLAMPLTFMNLSGNAVLKLVKKYAIEPVDLLVVCDDLDLEFGRLRLRPSGSSGGHRGLESIIGALGNTGFARLRIGIGRPREAADARDYVLSGFRREEKKQLKEILERAAECCEVWATEGVSRAMNIFNTKEHAQ